MDSPPPIETETPTQTEAPTETEAPRGDLPDASALEDRMPAWFRISKTAAAIWALLSAAFWFLSRRPLWHTDLWGHLAYGRELSQSGLNALWDNEPLLPVAQGVPFVDTAWLSQVIGYQCYEAFGVTALQFLYAASLTLCFGLLAWRFYHRTGDALVTVLGLAAFAGVAWQQMFVNAPSVYDPAALIRPQLAGWLCFIAVFVCLTSRRWWKAYWILIPAIFAVWVNLHGSFLMGLVMLGCFAAGRAIDIERRTRRIGAVIKDPWTVRYFLLLELSAAAVLLNPYGLRIYATVFEISNNPNFRNLVEWDPLTLRMNQGIATAFAALVLLFLYRWSPRRVKSAEVLLLTVFGGMALYYSRVLVWWSPIAAYSLVLHGHAVLKNDRKQEPAPKPARRSSLYTVACLGLLWIAFAFAPFGQKVLHGDEANFSKAVGNLTPVRVTDYLNKRAKENTLPPGLVFNSYQWGDYLVWAGPKELPVFVTSHVHYIPQTVWRHYFDIVNLRVGYEQLLDVYGVNMIVLSKSMHPDAIEQLQRDGPWQTDYEDDLAVVFTRRQPI